MALAGILQATFSLSTADAEKAAKRLQRTLGNELQDSLKGMGHSAGVAGDLLAKFGPIGIAAAAGVGAVGLGIRELVQEGDRLETLARQFRLTTDEVQRLENGGRGLGISIESLGKESAFLEKTLGSGSSGMVKALKELGLSYGQLASMPADERLIAVHGALIGIKDPLRQSALGAELLGKAFAKMTEVEFAEFIREHRENLILSGQTAEAGARLGDSWGRLAKNAKVLALEGLGPLAGKLADVVDLMNRATKTGAPDWLKTAWNVSVPGALWNASVAATGLALGSGGSAPADAHVEAWRRSQIGAGPDPEREAEIERQQKKRLAELAKQKEDMADFLKKVSSADFAATAAAKAYWEQVRADQEELSSIFAAFPDTPVPADVLERATMQFQSMGMAPSDLSVGGRFAGMHLSSTPPGGRLGQVDYGATAAKASSSLGDLNQELANLAHLADVIGPKWASVFSGLSSGLSGVQSIGGGISTMKGGGLMDILAGAGGIASGVGAIAGPLIALLKGLGGPDIGRDAGRDMGANISKELEKAIEESGKNTQLFLSEMWAEGALGIDRYAEEVADLMSFFERGDISKGTLLSEMQETLPILIENFGELGETGQAQVDRLTPAAPRMGYVPGQALLHQLRLEESAP